MIRDNRLAGRRNQDRKGKGRDIITSSLELLRVPPIYRLSSLYRVAHTIVYKLSYPTARAVACRVVLSLAHLVRYKYNVKYPSVTQSSQLPSYRSHFSSSSPDLFRLLLPRLRVRSVKNPSSALLQYCRGGRRSDLFLNRTHLKEKTKKEKKKP